MVLYRYMIYGFNPDISATPALVTVMHFQFRQLPQMQSELSAYLDGIDVLQCWQDVRLQIQLICLL